MIVLAMSAKTVRCRALDAVLLLREKSAVCTEVTVQAEPTHARPVTVSCARPVVVMVVDPSAFYRQSDGG